MILSTKSNSIQQSSENRNFLRNYISPSFPKNEQSDTCEQSTFILRDKGMVHAEKINRHNTVDVLVTEEEERKVTAKQHEPPPTTLTHLHIDPAAT